MTYIDEELNKKISKKISKKLLELHSDKKRLQVSLELVRNQIQAKQYCVTVLEDLEKSFKEEEEMQENRLKENRLKENRLKALKITPEILSEFRHSKKFTQQEVANLFGCSRSAWASWESNANIPEIKKEKLKEFLINNGYSKICD